MQIFTFFEIPKYFSYFYSLLLIYSIGKIVVGRFLCGWPSSAPTTAHLRVRSQPTPSASSGRCQVGLGASRTPHVSLTSSRQETATHPTRYRGRYRSNSSPSSAATLSVVAGQIPIDGPSTCHHPAPLGRPRVRLPH
jgi:hypothetical protein